MSKPRRTPRSASARQPPEQDELGAAVQDVSYRLTHDLSDTPADLRDAAAFAPLAAIKLAQRLGRAITGRPRRTLLVVAGLGAIALGMTALLRRKRS